MRGTREIKRRIKSVQSTQKITRAMEMVAAAKLRRAQERAESARPYTRHIRGTINRVLKTVRGVEHPFLSSQAEAEGKAFLVVSADKGLCGAYNSNVLRRAARAMGGEPSPQNMIVVLGRRGRDYFRRREYNIIAEYLDIEDYPSWEQVEGISTHARELFLQGTFREFYLVYNEFVNVMVHRPKVYRLLPMSPLEDEQSENGLPASAREEEEPESGSSPQEQEELLYRFEPEPEVVLEKLLPRYLNSIIYHGLLEAKAAEFGSRMAAMRNATDNAGDMIDNLTLVYNKARQSSITQEILEIVNTAEALKS